MPSEDIREVTAGDLGAVTGGTILIVDGGGNSPPDLVSGSQSSSIRPAEFVVISISPKSRNPQS
jgi:hypothetical protein